jgi:hypothetical protein
MYLDSDVHVFSMASEVWTGSSPMLHMLDDDQYTPLLRLTRIVDN